MMSVLRLSFAPWLALAALGACATAPHRAPVTSYDAGAPHPEDLVEIPGTSWIIVSAMRDERAPGRLLAFDAARPNAVRSVFPLPGAAGPDAAQFAPHGLGLRPLGAGSFELLVVDHGGGEAIDRFALRIAGGAPQIAWVDRVELPPGTWANGVTALPDGGFAITSMYDPADAAFVERFARAEPTGGIWRWSPRAGWRRLSELQLSGANGIALAPDATAVFVSEWAARRIWRVPLAGGEPRSVRVEFLPDNLRWTARGDLLVAGQRAAPQDLFGCAQRGTPCPLAFRVATVDPASLAVRTVLDGDDAWCARERFGGGTVALEHGGALWLGSFAEPRIARVPR